MAMDRANDPTDQPSQVSLDKNELFVCWQIDQPQITVCITDGVVRARVID